MKDEPRRYLQRVKKELKRYGDQNQEYYSGFVAEVESFLEENPRADAKALEQYFGLPKTIADDFLNTLTDDEIRQKIILREKLLRFARAAIIVVAIIVVLLVGYHVYDTWSFNHGETIYGTPTEEPPTFSNSDYMTY